MPPDLYGGLFLLSQIHDFCNQAITLRTAFGGGMVPVVILLRLASPLRAGAKRHQFSMALRLTTTRMSSQAVAPPSWETSQSGPPRHWTDWRRR